MSVYFCVPSSFNSAATKYSTYIFAYATSAQISRSDFKKSMKINDAYILLFN